MLTCAPDVSTKDQPALHAFVERASGRLAGIRNGILIFDQDRDSQGDVEVSIRNLQLLRNDAVELELNELVEIISVCEDSLRGLTRTGDVVTAVAISHSLDLVAKIEERLLSVPLNSDDFLPDISEFIDSSFRSFTTDGLDRASHEKVEDFEVDEETLEIFRSEAGELLRNISSNIELLRTSSTDREALWEIRRSAHTFKGSAGIVGLRTASELAHRVEDLLYEMVENDAPVEPHIIQLLMRSERRLDRMIFSFDFEEDEPIEMIHADFGAAIASVPARGTSPNRPDPPVTATSADKSRVDEGAKPAVTPIVRVSLDRLADLIKLSQDLAANRSAMVERFAQLTGNPGADAVDDVFGKLSSFFDSQRQLTEEMQEKLLQIRMVRFGMLETRLTRAVHVTCQEEGKKATVKIENGDCEVDTQIIDSLIEPLLHLIKNAVVHGIEPEDRRRLIGKPEKGEIRISVGYDDHGITLVVEDDGRGLSVSKLKEKAMQNGLISAEEAEVMGDDEAFDLMFRRGLTTADKLNLNAGRGVGMSIVKESVENCGGSVTIASEPQKGTQFTIKMPLVLPKPETTTSEVNSTPVVEPGAVPRRPLVLVVDDSPSVRRSTCRMVEGAGYQVISAQNGADALELLLSGAWQPDLILSDVEMPIMDGWEFLEYIKSNTDFKTIPFIMVTSLDADEHFERAARLGASDYHIKPVREKDLIDAISSQIETATN